MLANYHTHTAYCHHAQGQMREYVQAAIERGLKTLGFADHVPYPFPGGYESGFRLNICKLDEYFDTIKRLREEFGDKIDIKAGFEAEYYPKYFDDMLELIGKYDYQYLLMGQHFIGNEIDTNEYCLRPRDDESFLHRYIEQVIEGINTGKFLYIAHPDVLWFTGDEDVYYKEMYKLCREAKRLDIPLEINGLGMATNRIYPSERFFKIAAEVGNTVVVGSDAHSPDAVASPEATEKCVALARKLNLFLLDSPYLVK